MLSPEHQLRRSAAAGCSWVRIEDQATRRSRRLAGRGSCMDTQTTGMQHATENSAGQRGRTAPRHVVAPRSVMLIPPSAPCVCDGRYACTASQAGLRHPASVPAHFAHHPWPTVPHPRGALPPWSSPPPVAAATWRLTLQPGGGAAAAHPEVLEPPLRHLPRVRQLVNVSQVLQSARQWRWSTTGHSQPRARATARRTASPRVLLPACEPAPSWRGSLP